jgi:hypothetical protein
MHRSDEVENINQIRTFLYKNFALSETDTEVTCVYSDSVEVHSCNNNSHVQSSGGESVCKPRTVYEVNTLLSLRSCKIKHRSLSSSTCLTIKNLGIKKKVRGRRGKSKCKQCGDNFPVETESTKNTSQEKLSHKRSRPKPTGCNLNNIRPIENVILSPANSSKLTLCNANLRSVRNKAAQLLDYVITSNVDILVMVETWLTQHDSAIRSAITPDGYVFKDHPRQGRPGGGTGVLCRSSMNLKKVDAGEKTSFEFSEWQVDLDNRKFQICVIYRPPYSSQHPVPTGIFMEEFPEYLENTVMCQESLLLIGDFNIHVDDSSDPHAAAFMNMLEALSLVNHVYFQTHESGHALDLIISKRGSGITIENLVSDCYISDHAIVKCQLIAPRPKLTTKHIQYRKLKSIDITSFKRDVAESVLCSTEFQDIDELLACYNSTLSKLVDSHAPQLSKTIVLRPKQAWFDDHIKELKHAKRRCERKWRASLCVEDLHEFKKARNKYANVIEERRKKHISELVTECSGDQKKLFQVVCDLSNEKHENSLPDFESLQLLADGFGEFFVNKIHKINVKIDTLMSEENLKEYEHRETQCCGCNVSLTEFEAAGSELISTQSCGCKLSLNEFQVLQQEQVKRLISRSASKHCSLDPAPTWLIKNCLDILLPILTSVVNLSLQTGNFPGAWRCALVTPLLKKPDLEPVFSNFRPVSNLPYISKLVERAAVDQLVQHLQHHDLLPTMSSAYREFHSTETALIKVQSDILGSMDKQQATLLVMLDLSAAFDTVNYNILFTIMKNNFGITGTSLKWFMSYLESRKQCIVVENNLSREFELNCGVPQGSCLGPVLFMLYITSLHQVISKHLPSVHGYADDHQLYLSFKPDTQTEQDNALAAMEACVSDVRKWMIQHRLMINDTKTEFLILGSRQQLKKLTIDGIKIGDANILPAAQVKNLGVIMENTLSMEKQVNKICSKSFYQLYKLRQIRRYLTVEAAQTLVHAFVTSNLDYCNSLLYGISDYHLKKLQRVQNAALRLVLLLPKFSHDVSTSLCEQHWLPVKSRIAYKILLLTFKAQHNMAPSYIADMIVPYIPGRQLRSCNTGLLKVPKVKTSTMGARAFSHCAPRLWNTLPIEIRTEQSIGIFKAHLKTFLFKEAFSLF